MSGRTLSVVFGSILLLALAVRLWDIDREPEWFDEAFTARISARSMTRMAKESVVVDVHPPGYYSGLKAWRMWFGSSTASLRSYSTLWSIIGLAFLVLLTKEMTGRWGAALVAGLLLAIHPLDIYFAQEARMYSQAAALGLVSTWLLCRWIAAYRSGSSRRTIAAWLVAYTFVGAALVYTHYLGLFILVAQGLFVLAMFAWQADLRAILAYLSTALGVTLLFLPWLRNLYQNGLHDLDRVAWIAPPRSWDYARFLVDRYFLGRAGLGDPVRQLIVILTAALTVTSLWLFMRAQKDGTARRQRVLLAWMAWAPVALAVLVSMVWRPIYFEGRFPELAVAYFVALIGGAAWNVSDFSWRWLYLALVIGVFGGASLVQWQQISKPGMEAFAAYYRQNGPPDHMLFLPTYNYMLATRVLGTPIEQANRSQIERTLRQETDVTAWLLFEPHTLLEVPPRTFAALDWLRQLGPSQHLATLDGRELTQINARPTFRKYPSLERGQRLEFGEDETGPFLWTGWYPPEKSFCWSRGKAAEVLFSLDQPEDGILRLRLACFQTQEVVVLINEEQLDAFVCEQPRMHTREVAVPRTALQKDNVLTFRLPNAVSPAAVSESKDQRQLAIAVEWLELLPAAP